MFLILVIAIIVVCSIWGWIDFIEMEALRLWIPIILTGVCILSYKIPGVGYFFKFVTSAIASLKVLNPAVAWIASKFLTGQQLLLIQIVCCIAGTIILTKSQIDVTEYTILETEDLDIGRMIRRNGISLVDRFASRINKTRKAFVAERERKNRRIAEVEELKSMLGTSESNLNESYEKISLLEEQKCTIERNFSMYRTDSSLQIKKLEEKISLLEEESNRMRERYENRMRSETKKEARILFFQGCKDMEAIRTRYKKLVQEYHPDGLRGDHELFKMIQNEYERCCPKKRTKDASVL